MILLDFDKSILNTEINNLNDLKLFFNNTNIEILEYYINKTINEEERKHFFKFIIKGIFRLAKLYKNNIEILAQNDNKTLQLTKLQIAILLSNSFLCLYKNDNKNFSNMNFNKLYSSTKIKNTIVNSSYGDYMKSIAVDEINNGDVEDIFNLKIEKIKFIINYFDKFLRITDDNILYQCCIFERSSIKPTDYNLINKKLTCVEIIQNKGIDESSLISDSNILKVDFANKFIGGGVLKNGCVQEEILFLTYPELIAMCIFTEKLNDNEVLFMLNVEKYSNCSNYGYDIIYSDNDSKLHSNFVAIDSINYTKSKQNQFSIEYINRELHKAYIGFNHTEYEIIATGNWGCGMFGGNLELKFLIQWLAASYANKKLLYYPYSYDSNVRIQKIYNLILEKKMNTIELYMYIINMKN